MKSRLTAIIGLAIVAFTHPAGAYMVEITTSTPVASAVDSDRRRASARDRIHSDGRGAADGASRR